MDRTAAFIKLANSYFQFRVFLLMKLPAAFFAGVRVQEVDLLHCTTRIKYGWFSRNPFRSTYFACLAMAAEMSTGILSMMHVYNRNPAVSMLVINMEAVFLKKATGITRFTCSDGPEILAAIEKAIATGEGQTIRIRSAGTNEKGEPVADFYITWSYKEKTKK